MVLARSGLVSKVRNPAKTRQPRLHWCFRRGSRIQMIPGQ